MLYSLDRDNSYVGPSESTYYIIWNESTDKDATATVMDAYSKSTVTVTDATATVMDAYGKSTVTVTDVYSKYVYSWET